MTVTLGGAAARVKLGVCVAFTVNAIEVVRVSPPPLPLTMTVAAPKVAVLEAARVKTAVAPVVEVGLNVAVTPVGRPVAVNATPPVKPPVRVMLIVLVAVALLAIVKLVGLRASEKFGVGVGVGVGVGFEPTAGNGPRRNGARMLCLVAFTEVQSSLSIPPVSPEFGFKVQKVKFIPPTPWPM